MYQAHSRRRLVELLHKYYRSKRKMRKYPTLTITRQRSLELFKSHPARTVGRMGSKGFAFDSPSTPLRSQPLRTPDTRRLTGEFKQSTFYEGETSENRSANSVVQQLIEFVEDDRFRVDFDCSVLLEWASIGIECFGIFFQFVRSTRNWKVINREVSLARSLLFHRDYPCPPLICVTDSLSLGFLGSALLPNTFLNPTVPVHLSSRAASQATVIINASLTSSSSSITQPSQGSAVRNPSPNRPTRILQLFPTFPNPGHLLGAFSPMLFPIDTAHLHPEYRLALGAMALGLTNTLPHQHTTPLELEQFGRSVGDSIKVLNSSQEYPFDVWSKSNAYQFLEKMKFGISPCTSSTTRLPQVTGEIGCPTSSKIALIFKNETLTPDIQQNSDPRNYAAISELAAKCFGCDRTTVLPYIPVVEHEIFHENEDSTWSTEIFGYRCAVWTPSVTLSPSGSFHTLSQKRPSRRRATRIALKELPWEFGNFLLILAPMPMSLRPEVYLYGRSSEVDTEGLDGKQSHDVLEVQVESETHPSKPPPQTSIQRIIHLMRWNVPQIRSSRQLHRILHRFGLSVSLGLWGLWVELKLNEAELKLVTENETGRPGINELKNRTWNKDVPILEAYHVNDVLLKQFVACDIIAAAVKKVIRHHAW